MLAYHQECIQILGIRHSPNPHEEMLFARAQQYIREVADIPGIEMIAVCNSLSMYATHPDSDIDLFIVTRPDMLWLVRFLITMRFARKWVWRKGKDIAGNFCLSFFVTTNALDLDPIALKNDIYLAHWIYYLKPIINRHNTYERFLAANAWVDVPETQRQKNLAYCMHGEDREWTTDAPTFWQRLLNATIRFFLLRKTLRKYHRLGKPQGVIICDDMLKFHDQDRRETIRKRILAKNFDK